MIVLLRCQDGVVQRFHVNPRNLDRILVRIVESQEAVR